MGLFSFKFIKYGPLSAEDKTKVEESMLEMKEKFKTKPIEIGNTIVNDLYNRIDVRWQHAIKTKR